MKERNRIREELAVWKGKMPLTDKKELLRYGKFLFEIADYEGAVRYFELAGEAGCYAAWFYLGLCEKYELGRQGRQERAGERFGHWYREYHGDSKAQGKLVWESYCLLNGYGVEKDLGQAMENLRAVSDVKDAHAGLILGRAYMNGCFELKPDDKAALKYLERSASLGENIALYELSLLYQRVKKCRYREEAKEMYLWMTDRLKEADEKTADYNTCYQLYRHYKRGCVGIEKQECEVLAAEYEEKMKKFEKRN